MNYLIRWILIVTKKCPTKNSQRRHRMILAYWRYWIHRHNFVKVHRSKRVYERLPEYLESCICTKNIDFEYAKMTSVVHYSCTLFQSALNYSFFWCALVYATVYIHVFFFIFSWYCTYPAHFHYVLQYIFCIKLE